MHFFRDKKKIKASIEEYVASLKTDYGNDNYLPLQEICSDAGIELLQNQQISDARGIKSIQKQHLYDVWAFKFENGVRGVVYNPAMQGFPLLYGLTKKVGHHLLGHFEREPPICLLEAEAHYFSAAIINVPFLTLRCIDTPPISSLFTSKELIKQSLADHYSLYNKPELI